MNWRHPSFLRALLLLIVAIGPLQAQAVFACAMMDTVVREGCCCDEPKFHEQKPEEMCAGAACESIVESGHGPCCERSVEIGVDADARADTPTVKQTEPRSDVDPPQAIHTAAEALFSPLPSLIPGSFHRTPPAGQSGSDIWLTTQRLRI